MVKILQFSDSHLGLIQYGNKERLVDLGESLMQIANLAIAEQVDLVVNCGDTFDKSNPDPMSVYFFRKFMDALWVANIKCISIMGNHDTHEISNHFAYSWMEAVSDWVIRPSRENIEKPTIVSIPDRQSGKSISVAMADWMPSTRIGEFLGNLPGTVDALFMHQSTEGLLPVIGRPEMMISQVDGRARYVGVGDIHVSKIMVGELGTVIGSAGPTEMIKRDENPQKFVLMVNIEPESETPPVCEMVPIKTREFVVARSIFDEMHIIALDAQIRAIINSGNRPPMVIGHYSRAIQERVLRFEQSIKDLGCLVSLQPEPEVQIESAVAQQDAATSTTMKDILSEIQDESLRAFCLALWASPKSSAVTINAFREQIIKKYAHENNETCTEQHLPAPQG